jgi:murein hydrolase activator
LNPSQKGSALWPALRRTLVLSLLTIAPLPALAQQPTDPEAARKKLEADQRQLQDKRKREKEIQSELGRTREEREFINQESIRIARLIQQSEASLATIEQRVGELEEQEKLLQGSMEQRHAEIAKLLASMQRMGRNPPPVMITRREDALSMVRSAMLLATAFPELRTQALALADKLKELVRVKDDIRAKVEDSRTENTRLASAQAQLQSVMAEKNQTLAERQAEFAEVRRATAEITRSVTDLNELIGKLDKAVAEKTRLGAYEKQLQAEAQRHEALRQQEIAATAAQQPAPTATAQPAPDATTKSAETVPATPSPKPTQQAALPPAKAPETAAPQPSAILAPSNDRLAMASPGRIQPAIPFHLAKGRLPLPAQGRRVLSFGDRHQTGKSQGLVIETRQAAQITSPNDGWVMYAGEFRSYGQILIINAGGGYNILLAGLSQTNVQVGQFVLAGEPIGKMAASPIAAPKTAATLSTPKPQESAPVLYVEFRKDGQPINPDPWWLDTARKVQG